MPLSTERFTHTAYTGALSRRATDGEVDDWTGALDPLIDLPAQLLAEARSLLSALFLSSAYTTLGTTNTAFVEDVYLAYLGRVPESAESTAGVAAVASTSRTAFLTSAGQLSEFIARIASLYAEPSTDVPAFPTEALGGPHPSKRRTLPPDYKPLINKHTFEDKGISVGTSGDVPILRWEEDYSESLLDEWEEQILLDHYESARHDELTFDYTDPSGVVRTGVRYESFENDHQKTWMRSVRIGLIKYPS